LQAVLNPLHEFPEEEVFVHEHEEEALENGVAFNEFVARIALEDPLSSHAEELGTRKQLLVQVGHFASEVDVGALFQKRVLQIYTGGLL
jgi:hypothetical protein